VHLGLRSGGHLIAAGGARPITGDALDPSARGGGAGAAASLPPLVVRRGRYRRLSMRVRPSVTHRKPSGSVSGNSRVAWALQLPRDRPAAIASNALALEEFI